MSESEPALSMTYEIQGLAELQRRFDKAAMQRVAKGILEAVLKELKVLAIPYPEEGDYNRPGPYPKRWYQRKFGPRWARKNSEFSGGRDTSEQLQDSWVTEVKDPFQGVIGNKASYSNYVMGSEQAEFHARHGWKRLDKIAGDLDRSGKIEAIVKQQVAKELEE
jgi:hypothetical protein